MQKHDTPRFRAGLRSTFRLTSALVIASAAVPAYGQMLDHSGYEQLFGEPITSTATGQPVRESHAPVNLDIVTADEIARSGARTIPEVLDRLAGVQMLRNGELDQQVSIRGYAQGMQNRILVLINNRQVYADSYGYTPWQALPVQLDEIRQIEVVRGPNTALFGFNAAAGVINIITRDPRHDETVSARLERGTNGTGRASAVVSKSVTDRLGVRVSAGIDIVEPYVDPAATLFAPPDDDHAKTVSGEIRYSITDRITAAFDASYAMSGHLQTDPTGLHLDWNHEITSGRGSITADTDFGLVFGQVSHTRTDISFAGVPGLSQVLDTTIAELSNTVRVTDKDTVRIAGQYRRVVGDILSQTPGAYGHVGYDGLGLSAMWTRAVTDSLSLTAAGRLDYLQLFSEGEFGPFVPYTAEDIDNRIRNVGFTFAGSYAPTANDTFRASISRGASLPSILELGAIQLPSIQIDNGAPDALATQITNYEIGYERRVDPLFTTFSAAAFYQTNRDIMNVARWDAFGTHDANYDDIDYVGVELGMDGAHGDFSWGASYSYLLPLDNAAFSFRGVAIPYDPARQAPKHEVEAQLGYRTGNLTLDAFARYRSSFDVLQRGLIDLGPPFLTSVYLDPEIDEQLSIDLQASYDLSDNVQLTGLLQQVNDGDVRTGSFQRSDRRAYVGLKVTF